MNKKLLITEDDKNFILNLYGLLKESAMVTVTGKIPTSYDSMSTDPKNFINLFMDDVMNKINSNPEHKKYFDNGQLKISNIDTRATASNSWPTTDPKTSSKTAYDMNNNDTAVTPTGSKEEMDLYNKNKDLALNRAKFFNNALITELKKKNIIYDPYTIKIANYNYVIDTGGLSDSKRDKAKFPNPGQTLSSRIKFEVTAAPTLDFNKITSYTQIRPNFILTGAYFCDGKNSLNSDGDEDTYVSQCKDLQNLNLPESEKHKYVSAWEIKWNLNVNNNPFVVPVTRWNFFWGPDKKINKVYRQQFNQEYQGKKLFDNMVPTSTVTVDDPVLKYFMGVKQGDPNGGGPVYKELIEPYKKK